MRLISATLRHYRVHRELTVDFDPGRTLIGGPNESGKSTLVEAIHRALFLRAKGTSETHQLMESTRHGGKPEVELVFEQGGTTYRLHKRFSGASGTVTLTPGGRAALSGAAAEEALARLCGVDNGARAKASAEFWSHLWTWQGTSTENPAEHAERQKDALLQRLGQTGGAANLIQSERDARVAGAISAQRQALFTQRGEPKANTDLARAVEENCAAEAALAAARERLDRMHQTLQEHGQAVALLAESERALARLEKEHRENQVKLAQVTELRNREGVESEAAQRTERELTQRQQIALEIAALERRRDEASRALAPLSAEADRQRATREAAQASLQEAERAQAQAEEHVRHCRLHHELAATQLALVEKRILAEELKARAAQVAELEKQLAQWRSELAQLPHVEAAQLQRLRQLEEARVRAAATLQGVATSFEVLATDVPVAIGDSVVEAGQPRVLVDETEIRIGANVHLRIRPGGGKGLRAAREDAHEAESKLRQALDELTVASLTEAENVARQRETLELRIRNEATRLSDLGAPNLAARLHESSEAIARLTAEIGRRQTALAQPAELPIDGDGARAFVDAAAAALREAELKAQQARALREANVRQAASAEVAQTQAHTAAEQKRRLLAEADAQLQLMRAQHGSDEVRAEHLQRARTERDTAHARLRNTRVQLAALSPDDVAADRVRVERALEQTQRTRHEAEVRRQVAQRALQSDGTQNPEEELELAEARCEAAAAREASLRRQARAVQWLDDLFRAERQAMSDQFTQPLLEKAAGYVQRVFGPGARLEMRLENNVFSAPMLIRPGEAGGATPYSSLSGGTKEQVAAALRLAMAEVLAADHGGCLPVVFDDSFAFADPQRVQVLQRMLDLAATRGLQVIVATCTPSDYMALGAQIVLLTPTSGTSVDGPFAAVPPNTAASRVGESGAATIVDLAGETATEPAAR